MTLHAKTGRAVHILGTSNTEDRLQETVSAINRVSLVPGRRTEFHSYLVYSSLAFETHLQVTHGMDTNSW